MHQFSSLCLPAKIYFSIAVIAAIIAFVNSMPVMMIFWRLVFAFVWTWIINWLCRHGHKNISWVLVLLPYIIMFLSMMGMHQLSEPIRSYLRMFKLQGAYGQEPMTDMKKKPVA